MCLVREILSVRNKPEHTQLYSPPYYVDGIVKVLYSSEYGLITEQSTGTWLHSRGGLKSGRRLTDCSP